MCTASAQAFTEIKDILVSLPSVNGVRIEINAEFFGVDWAQSDDCQQDRYVGTVKKWKEKGVKVMVKWDGWDRHRARGSVRYKVGRASGWHPSKKSFVPRRFSASPSNAYTAYRHQWPPAPELMF